MVESRRNPDQCDMTRRDRGAICHESATNSFTGAFKSEIGIRAIRLERHDAIGPSRLIEYHLA